MFERFTDRARRVVVLAQEEARLLNHNYIGTEHILLGLIHEGEGVAARALEGMGISLESVRSQVVEIMERGGQGAVQVAAACAAAGIVVGVASLTGIGLRMSELIITLSGGNLLIAP